MATSVRIIEAGEGICVLGYQDGQVEKEEEIPISDEYLSGLPTVPEGRTELDDADIYLMGLHATVIVRPAKKEESSRKPQLFKPRT